MAQSALDVQHPRAVFFSGPNAASQAADFFTILMRGGQNQFLQAVRNQSLFDSIAQQAGGTTSYSATAKELRVYEHDYAPYEASRGYLEDRDALAWYATTEIANDMWLTFPRLSHEQHEKFLSALQVAMLLKTARDVEAMARRDGVAYLYIRATGRPDEPIQPGDRIIAFSPLGYWQIQPHNVQKHRGDDPILLRHGIEKVVVETADTDGKRMVMDVHGHRLVPFVRNRGRGYLWPAYDDLWYMKDILYSLRVAQWSGNPIKVEVDPKWLELVGENLTDAELETLKEKFKADAARVQQQGKGHFAPVNGLKIERVGATGGDDPVPALKALASRIALTTGISGNRVLASSKGSESITDEDRIDEMTYVYKHQLMEVAPVYEHLLELARLAKIVAVRAPNLPFIMKWPFVRVLNPREEAYVKKSNVSILKTALDAGHWPDDEIMAGFRAVTEPMDPTLVLPKQAPWDPQLREKLRAEREQKELEQKDDDANATPFNKDGSDELHFPDGTLKPLPTKDD